MESPEKVRIITSQNLQRPNYPIGINLKSINDFICKMVEMVKEEYPGIQNTTNTIVLWCRGSSGAILASAFAMKLGAPNMKIKHVKKPGEISHYHNNNLTFNKSYINFIIDDFVVSGETIEHIVSVALNKKDRKTYRFDALLVSSDLKTLHVRNRWARKYFCQELIGIVEGPILQQRNIDAKLIDHELKRL